jgi:ribosomal protein S18 acetylase RimI-like enzyme
MKGIFVKHVKDPDPGLVEALCRMEVGNLGQEAAINQWVLPVIIRYGKLFIAVNNKDNLIGVCEIIRSYPIPSTAFIHSFYIDGKFRDKGIGKILLEKVLDELKSDLFKEVQLTIDPDNRAASRLYRSFGFKKKGTRKDEYGRGIIRELFSLKL